VIQQVRGTQTDQRVLEDPVVPAVLGYRRDQLLQADPDCQADHSVPGFHSPQGLLLVPIDHLTLWPQ